MSASLWSAPTKRTVGAAALMGLVLLISAQGGQAQAEDLPVELKGRTGSIVHLEFSHDGTRLVTVTYPTNEVRLWNLSDGSSRVLIEQKSQSLATFLPDGKTVVAGVQSSLDQPATAIAWNVETGEAGLKMPGTLQAVSPAGTIVLDGIVNEESGFRVWDASAGKEVLVLPYPNDVTQVRISSDGRTVAMWGGKKVRLYDVAAGKERAGIEGLRANLYDAAISPDGSRIACLENVGGPSLWDTSNAAARPRLLGRNANLKGHKATFSMDGKMIAVYEPSNSLHLVDADDSLEIRTTVSASYGVVFTSIGNLAAPTSAGRSAGSQFLVADSDGKTLGVIDAGAEVEAYAVARDGAKMALAFSDGMIRVVPLPGAGQAIPGGSGELKKIADLPLPRLATDGLLEDERGTAYLAFSPDGKYLAVSPAYARGPFAAWDVNARKVAAVGGHRLGAWAYMPDGKSIFAQEKDDGGNGLEVAHDLATGRKKVVNSIKRTGVVVHFRYALLAASPDGKFVATVPGTADELHLRPAGEAGASRVLVEGAGGIARVAFSAKSQLLAAAVGSEVRLYDLVKNTETPTNAANGYDYLEFADDGAVTSIVDVDKSTAYVYEVASGQMLQEIDLQQGHSGRIYGATFSPVSTLYVSYDADGELLLKNWKSGEELSRTKVHDSAVVAACFSMDGKMLATATHGADEGAVRVWSVVEGK